MGLKVHSWTTVGIIIGNMVILMGLLLAFFHLTQPEEVKDLETEFKGIVPEMDQISGSERSPRSMPSNNSQTRCEMFEWECNNRLMSQIYPVHYNIFLNPFILEGLFIGRVSILLNVSKSVDHIRLHLKDLQVTNVSLTVDQDKKDEVLLKSSFVYAPNEYFVIQPSSTLKAGMYELVLNFNGSLRRGIVGFYRSEYFDPLTNKTQYVVSTKFQPTYARRAFPSFDEPQFKSTFSMSLVKPSHLVALSNMPVLSEEVNEPRQNETIVHFAKSVPMVTYLVVVAIGDFDFTTGKSERGIPVRVFATKFQVEKTQYAVSVVPKMIDYYEKYFGINYPLPKLDIVGIPDFVSGAMEHWGLISFRESNLLYHPKISTVSNKQRVASVLAHEIAHMWFGNLMTLKWWSDLWLNEGFASYCEYKAVNHVHPEWEMEAQFVTQDLTSVLVLDAKLSSHPILQTVTNPDEITEIFDSISYNKGASVIRMLEYFIGPEKFGRGVSKFLTKFSYKNAETKDLWENLESEMGTTSINISLVMDTWTRQMGYPILTIETKDNQVTIRQERYLMSPNSAKKLPSIQSIFGYKWEIPLKILTGNESQNYQNVIMHHTQDTIVVPITHKKKWTKVNPNFFGYFRVQYSTEGWRDLKNNYNHFVPTERCELIDDLFSFAYSQHVTYDLALDFAQSLNQEKHFVPWDCAESHLTKISSLLQFSSSNETYVAFTKYITNVTSKIYKSLSWVEDENETHLNGLLKLRIFSLACSHENADCLENTSERFNNWIQNGTIPPPALRPVVYKWGMWQANDKAWEIVWMRYLNETDAQERTRLLSSLASTRHPTSLRRLMSFVGNESLVRRQDFFTTLSFVANNPIGNPILWKFYRDEYENLVKRFTVNDRYFGKMILDITAYYSSSSQIQQIIDFFKLYPVAGAGKRARETTMETVQANYEWEQRNVPVINKWLKTTNFNV